MKNLFFKGVKIDSKVAPQLEAYVQKAYKCYYNGVDALMVTSIGLPSSNEWLEDLDLEPQDSYYQW